MLLERPAAGLTAAIRCVALIALAIAAAVPAAVAQNDVRSLADRVERLQRDVDTLNRQLARSGVPTGVPAATAPPAGFSSAFIDRTDARFSELDRQVRELTGRLEEVTFRLGEINSRLDRLMGDLEFRLGALERGGSAVAPVPATPAAARSGAASPPPDAGRGGEPRVAIVPGPAAQAAPPALLPPGTPEQQFSYAYGELVKAQRGTTDFDRPEQLLRLFVQTNGSHRLAGSAQYWLGETYFARKDYRRSAVAFAEGLQRYPNSDKGPDNLLRLGQSLAQLNRTREACGTLGEMERRYPQAPQSVRRDATRERQRLNCA